MTDTILARLAELKTMATPDLKASWRELFATEPPAYNRRFFESRLAYRIQELAYGGLKPQTIERLKALGEQLDGGNIAVSRIRGDDRPIAGTRLIREWQGSSCRTDTNGRAGPISPFRRLRAPSPAPAGMAGSSLD